MWRCWKQKFLCASSIFHFICLKCVCWTEQRKCQCILPFHSSVFFLCERKTRDFKRSKVTDEIAQPAGRPQETAVDTVRKTSYTITDSLCMWFLSLFQDIDDYICQAKDKSYDTLVHFGRKGLNVAATAAVMAATKVVQTLNICFVLTWEHSHCGYCCFTAKVMCLFNACFWTWNSFCSCCWHYSETLVFPASGPRSSVRQVKELQHAGSVFLPVWPC